VATTEELELLHAELDEALDVHQRARLSRALLADPDLHVRREELRRLAAALASVPDVEPPAGFPRAVLAALPQPAASALSPWWSSPAFRHAAAIAALIAAGAVVYAVIDGRGPPTAEIAGTLGGSRTPTVLDTVELSSGPVRGRARLTGAEAGLAVEFELEVGTPVQVLVTRAGQTLAAVDVGADAPAPVVVRLPGVTADGAAVELSFRAGGREVAHASLRAPAGT
jgi:hypothetical protein